MMSTRWVLAFLVLLCGGNPARAAITTGAWNGLFNGIEHATGYANGQGGDPLQKVNCLRIDLRSGVELYTTPHSGSNETITRKTGDFLLDNDLQVAINAHFFSPFDSFGTSYETNPIGALVSQGSVVSPSSSGYEELLITQRNTPWYDTTPSNNHESAWTGVAGNTMLLINGTLQHSAGGDVHPRTAVGTSADGRYLFMMTIDGRQSASDGATYRETGEWLARFGAYNGLNLDGGGSTTMVMDDGQGDYDLLNVPVGNWLGWPGTERWVGSSFGVWAAPDQGDFNGDGVVNSGDLTAWENGFGRDRLAVFGDGDADLDGDVDLNDLLIWQRHATGGASSSAVAAPEPSTLGLLALAVVGFNYPRLQKRAISAVS